MPRILQVLSQRPSRTGSGVTLDALVREAARAGWEQAVVVGTPADDGRPDVGGLDAGAIHPLRFGTDALPFALPGMSDVMPYETSVFSRLSTADIARYRDAWTAHLARVVAAVRPEVIHVHHVWLVSALMKDVAPDVPVVVHGHATGLRQMELCPHLADDVRAGCTRNDGFLALTAEHAERTVARLGVARDRVHVVGAGYRDDVFDDRPRPELPGRHLICVGKLSRAKGVPWLLDAFARVAARHDDVSLHLVGAGVGAEAAAIERRARGLSPRVVLHGRAPTDDLARLMGQADVFVLPSLYEGLPLVVIEALASGCRAVCTALPGVTTELLPRTGDAIDVVPLPRLENADEPVAADEPAFVDALEAGLERALAKGPRTDALSLEAFTWRAVFARVEEVWRALLAQAGADPVRRPGSEPGVR